MPCLSDTRCFEPSWIKKKGVLCGCGRLQMKGRRFLRSCLCVSAFDFSLALSLANQEETAAAPSRRTWCAGHKTFLHTHLVQTHVSCQSWGLQAKWCFPLIPFPGACRVCPTECTGRELEGPVAVGVLLKSSAGPWEGSPELSWGIQLSRTLCRGPDPGPTCTFIPMLNYTSPEGNLPSDFWAHCCVLYDGLLHSDLAMSP